MNVRRLLIAAACAMAPAVAAGQEKAVAFVNAHVIPIVGPEIDKGTVVIQGSKIIAVGAAGAVSIPAGAQSIDCAGKVVMPGLVDTHNHIGGIGGADGSATLQPEVRVSDSLNPMDSGFRRAVAGGLTTLNIMPGSGHLMSGQTVYVKMRGSRTIEELTIRDDQGRAMGGMKMANGTNPMRDPPFAGTRGKAAAMVRELYTKALDYRARRARAAAGQPAGAGEGDEKDKGGRDLGMEALLEVLDGKRMVHHHTHRADDIMTVLRLKQEFGFRVVLHHVSEAWKVADEIAKAGVPCSVIIVDSPGGKLEAAEMTAETGAILEKAGVKVAFHTDDWITDVRMFMRMAALAVRAGMTRQGALAALTIRGAEMLDLGGRIGSLEAGKDADVIVLSGDPFSVYSHVEQTWVEGKKVFDRSNDKDRLYATGGFGAGHDQAPYFCCFGDGSFVFGRNGAMFGAGGE